MQTEYNNIKDIVFEHIQEIGEDIIHSEIEEIKEDFVPVDWELKFESLDEAYKRTGKYKAEKEIFLTHAYDVIGEDASKTQIKKFIQEMSKQLNIYIQKN